LLKLHSTLMLVLLAGGFSSCCVADPASAKGEEKFVFETWSKQKIDAFRGSFDVPENRANDNGRTLSIRYVRLPATGTRSGPPIVYLAGGPGASGIDAINYRYRMFTAMRKHGDVIALDQRGTGASNVIPACRSEQIVPTMTPISDEEFTAFQRRALRECLRFWRQRGIDLAGYNTVQNALDLEALRVHLGAKKIVLWGTSYGSHLALAALKEIESSIAAIVISSVEGLGDTIKLPASTDRYFERLQQAVATQPAAMAAYPDVIALIRRVHAKLEAEPVRVTLKTQGDSTIEFLLQPYSMQLLAGALIADPKSTAVLLEIYRDLDRGIAPSFERIPARQLPDAFADAGRGISLNGMQVAMDLASGMSADHRAAVAAQRADAILGGQVDPTLQFDGMVPALDLGDAFRARPASEVPVLVLSGTLDGRTVIDRQQDAVSQLRNATVIVVNNGGHNLIDAEDSRIQETIDRFLFKQPIERTTFTIPLADMAPRTE
jgi:pimeloyl-ACP methyl ester carboxylesterase